MSPLVLWDHESQAWLPLQEPPAPQGSLRPSAWGGANAAVPASSIDGFPDGTNTGLARLGLTADDMDPVLGEFGAFADGDHYRRLFDVANYSGTERTRVDYGEFVATESLFRGAVETNSAIGLASIDLTDCDVDCSDEFILGIGYHNLRLIRCNIWGGAQTVNVGGPNEHGSIYAQDCYIHDPNLIPGTGGHVNPFFCGRVGEGYSVHFDHCTFFAPVQDDGEGGGATSNLTFLPDFGPINNVTVENCLIKWTGGAYGAYFGWAPGKPFNDHPLNATNIVVRNVIFERGPSGQTAQYGPVTSWRPHETNVWENVRYDDGTPIPEPTI